MKLRILLLALLLLLTLPTLAETEAPELTQTAKLT